MPRVNVNVASACGRKRTGRNGHDDGDVVRHDEPWRWRQNRDRQPGRCVFEPRRFDEHGCRKVHDVAGGRCGGGVNCRQREREHRADLHDGHQRNCCEVQEQSGEGHSREQERGDRRQRHLRGHGREENCLPRLEPSSIGPAANLIAAAGTITRIPSVAPNDSRKPGSTTASGDTATAPMRDGRKNVDSAALLIDQPSQQVDDGGHARRAERTRSGPRAGRRTAA